MDNIWLDFTENEVLAVERVMCQGASDSADMRTAIHEMIVELARYKEIDVSDIDLEEGVDEL